MSAEVKGEIEPANALGPYFVYERRRGYPNTAFCDRTELRSPTLSG